MWLNCGDGIFDTPTPPPSRRDHRSRNTDKKGEDSVTQTNRRVGVMGVGVVVVEVRNMLSMSTAGPASLLIIHVAALQLLT